MNAFPKINKFRKVHDVFWDTIFDVKLGRIAGKLLFKFLMWMSQWRIEDHVWYTERKKPRYEELREISHFYKKNLDINSHN